MSLVFKVGDQAVYAGHGVGVIKSIEVREIAGYTETFYSIHIQDSEMNILVPQNRTSDKGGLRPVASNDKVQEVIKFLKEEEVPIKELNNWNKKLQEYTKKLKIGSLKEVAQVLKDLTLLKKRKNLSFGEKQLMNTAWNLIFREISVVLGTDKSRDLLVELTGVNLEPKH